MSIKLISLLILLFGGMPSFAQFFYKDIISNNQLQANMKAYKENNVKKITIKSFEDDGEESEGFFCEKKFSNNYRKVELFTKAYITSPSLFLSVFDDAGKLISTNDSSEFSVTKIKYSYTDKGNIATVFSTIVSKDDDFINTITEEHIYNYNNNVLENMIRVKNKKDTSIILFALDDNGNVAIEKDTKSGTKFYFYYDIKNRLTDIVQENEYKNTLKPDYVFEYNNAGLITQMTAVEEGSNNYFLWKYTYENGLRTKEKCFTDERKLMGSIEYVYK